MNQQTKSMKQDLEERIRTIVSHSENIRQDVSDMISGMTDKFQLSVDEIVQMSNTTVEQASELIKDKHPGQADRKLKEVIDGVGDGIAVILQAAELALKEAEAGGKQFAREDLKRFSQDLQAIGSLIADTFGDFLNRLGDASTTQIKQIQTHLQRTLQRLQPTVESVIQRIQRYPLQIGSEAIETGISATKQTVETLFSSLGRFIHALNRDKNKES